jgi:transcriptional regulator with XRE-family HTH domain
MNRKKKPTKPKVIGITFPRAIEWRVELGQRLRRYRELSKLTPEEKFARANPDMVTRFNKVSPGIPLTLSELADRLNAIATYKRRFSPSTLSRFEKGHRIPSILSLGYFVKVFGIKNWEDLIPPTNT